MKRARLAVVLLIALPVVAGRPTTPLAPPPAEGSPTRRVTVDRVHVVVPVAWDIRRLGDSTHRRGLRAASDVDGWVGAGRRAQGLEAYWVDATGVGVPSDYYYLAASGPAGRIPGGRGCRAAGTRVVLDHRPRFDRTEPSAGTYVALATGTCRTKRHKEAGTRWVSFVAAPGFGPVGEMGIPQSGLYYALVVVEDGPNAGRRAKRLLGQVRFDGTPVRRIVEAAGGQL